MIIDETTFTAIELSTEANRDVTLQPDLEYVRDHFVGAPMKANWSPPPIEILGKRKRLRDDRSAVLRSPSVPGRILSVSRAVFVPERVPEVPIFKIPEWTSVTFVRRQFVDAVIDNGLRGAAFADPGVEPLGPIMRG